MSGWCDLELGIDVYDDQADDDRADSLADLFMEIAGEHCDD